MPNVFDVGPDNAINDLLPHSKHNYVDDVQCHGNCFICGRNPSHPVHRNTVTIELRVTQTDTCSLEMATHDWLAHAAASIGITAQRLKQMIRDADSHGVLELYLTTMDVLFIRQRYEGWLLMDAARREEYRNICF